MTILSRTGNIAEDVAIKAPVRCGTTANIELAGLDPQEGLDGVTVQERDRVLVLAQSDPTQNGIYNASSGNWTRTVDCSKNTDLIKGTLVYVGEGSTLRGKLFAVSTATSPIIIGTTAISWAQGTALFDLVPLQINQGGTGGTDAPSARSALGAAAAADLSSLTSTVASEIDDIDAKLATGLNTSDPTRFGALAKKDTIDNLNLIDSSVQAALNPFVGELLHVRYTEASGTAGSIAVGNKTWSDTPLNEIVTNNIGAGVSLASNVLTLPQGTYLVMAAAMMERDGAGSLVVMRLRNTADGTTVAIGLHAHVNSTASQVTARGVFTLDASKTLKVQMWSDSGGASNGQATSSGEKEVYVDMLIWKIG